MNLKDVLTQIDALLKHSQIEYAVIGGYAVAAWGEMRATRDIDLLCSAEDLATLKAALLKSGMRFEHRVGDPDDPISDVMRIDLGAGGELYEVDVLAGIREAPAGILERSRPVQIQDLAVPVASPEDIIILKILGGSARDIEDARSILRTQKGRIDLSLIRQLCPLPLMHVLESLLKF
jgi:predicted nucleotidyltransferase